MVELSADNGECGECSAESQKSSGVACGTGVESAAWRVKSGHVWTVQSGDRRGESGSGGWGGEWSGMENGASVESGEYRVEWLRREFCVSCRVTRLLTQIMFCMSASGLVDSYQVSPFLPMKFCLSSMRSAAGGWRMKIKLSACLFSCLQDLRRGRKLKEANVSEQHHQAIHPEKQPHTGAEACQLDAPTMCTYQSGRLAWD